MKQTIKTLEKLINQMYREFVEKEFASDLLKEEINIAIANLKKQVKEND